ncbi:FecR family protein [Galbibacter orientalis]|uniref:FecR family protein n=1 Tax=Galbibacter orientalis TaxID=453852 RepID=UPI00307FF74D
MIPSKIEDIIVKFLTNAATLNELEVLHEWIENDNNAKVFKTYIETHFAIAIAMNQPDLKKVKQDFLKDIKKEKRKQQLQKITSVVKYAAVVIFIVGASFLAKNQFFPESIKESISSREEQITLQLANGELKSIKNGAKEVIKNPDGQPLANNDGNKLSYQDNKEDSSPLVYNKLTIPYGKKYNLILADGTQVVMNSGSVLKFPVKFSNKKERRVYLTGEAFFTVAHNEHKPFFVEANGMEVKVYGTEFNLKSYTEDLTSAVVLVNGSVSLADNNSSKKEEIKLVPGERGSLDRRKKVIKKDKVDTSIYTSWIKGDMVFKNEPFKNIIKALERNYNVVIINNNDALNEEHFNATIETKYESIEQVFNYFSKVYDIEYRVIENKIVIN